MMFLRDPLEQFSFVALTWFSTTSGLNITNVTIIMALVFLLIHILLQLRTMHVESTWLNFFLLNIYSVSRAIIKRNTMHYEYFSHIFSLFIFIFISNFVGLFPYSFTITSSFILTFFLSLSYFIAATWLGVVNWKWEFGNMFLPNGVPLILTPLLIPIEIISYFSRVLSLSIRLFANMLSGHALLKILIGFSWALISSGPLFALAGVLPWLVVTAILFLELLIAFLQAYVFAILVALYINDVFAVGL